MTGLSSSLIEEEKRRKTAASRSGARLMMFNGSMGIGDLDEAARFWLFPSEEEEDDDGVGVSLSGCVKGDDFGGGWEGKGDDEMMDFMGKAQRKECEHTQYNIHTSAPSISTFN